MARWIKAALPAAALGLSGLAADYFFRYIFTRAEKPDPWRPEEQDQIPKNRAFFENTPRELLTLTSRDGLKLKAWFYDRGARVTVILCHGYRGGPEELTDIASHLYARGMNVLLIYQRAHGLSEGTYFTMGGREKRDIADWASLLARRRPEGKLVLFGWSMGGNSVMGAVGEDLPGSVVCAVEDCGYESLYRELLYTCCKDMPRLPCKKVWMELLTVYCRLFRGFDVKERRLEALGRCKVPMLFIHGTADTVVPFENLGLCYDECAAEKLCAVYAGAGHIRSRSAEPGRYFGELFAFIRKHTQEEGI